MLTSRERIEDVARCFARNAEERTDTFVLEAADGSVHGLLLSMAR